MHLLWCLLPFLLPCFACSLASSCHPLGPRRSSLCCTVLLSWVVVHKDVASGATWHSTSPAYTHASSAPVVLRLMEEILHHFVSLRPSFAFWQSPPPPPLACQCCSLAWVVRDFFNSGGCSVCGRKDVVNVRILDVVGESVLALVQDFLQTTKR